MFAQTGIHEDNRGQWWMEFEIEGEKFRIAQSTRHTAIAEATRLMGALNKRTKRIELEGDSRG